MAQPAGSDDRFEAALARVLQVGVGLSAAVIAVGGAIYLWRHGAEQPVYQVFRGEPSDFRSVAGILMETKSGSGRGIIQLGLLLLIATPVARVVFSIVGFLRERDWLYVGVTAFVLALLLYSLWS